MKKRLVAAPLLLIALLGLYRGAKPIASSKDTPASNNRSSSSISTDQNNETTNLPTKVSDRPATAGPHATHRPDQLKQFYLPDVNIEGLLLRDALAKVQAVYEDVCRESGEVPLSLTFLVPPEATRPLTVKTGIRNLDGAIHLLAAMSGLKVSRTGSEYAFTAPKETGEVVKKDFRLPPDFFSDPSKKEADPFAEAPVIPDGMSLTDHFMALTNKDDDLIWTDPDEPVQLSPAEYFASKGITLDPDTKLTRSPDGSLKLETTSAADRTTIEGLIEVNTSELPLQHKLETKLVYLSPDMNWTPPDSLQLNQGEMQLMIRQLMQSKGADVMTTPTITARVGENAKVEIVREFLVPSQTEPGGFESQPTGAITEFRPSPYGFGHHVDLNYTERIPEGESGTATARVNERTAISDSSFSGDGNASMHVQTHPDGSRSVVFVTPTLIDATGRPINPK
ncbi:MAG TPA: hypothetical protein VGE67_17515 [Haloferula sp.]